MKRIEEYVNSVYKSVGGNTREIEELKEEMKSHLLEAVYELKAQGFSEDEAIDLAIEKFGDKKQMVKGLSEFFYVQKRFARALLLISIVSLVISIFFFVTTINNSIDFKAEKEIITNDTLRIVGSSNELSSNQKQQLLKIFIQHQDKISHLAVFNVQKNQELQQWIKENSLKEKATTIIPILEYKEAEIIVDQEGEVKDKEKIVASEYDLGTVVQANDKWVVQYEYRDTYHKVIEANNLLVLGYYTDIFYLPILFFVVFGVLIIIWGFLKKYHKKYLHVLTN